MGSVIQGHFSSPCPSLFSFEPRRASLLKAALEERATITNFYQSRGLGTLLCRHPHSTFPGLPIECYGKLHDFIRAHRKGGESV